MIHPNQAANCVRQFAWSSRLITHDFDTIRLIKPHAIQFIQKSHVPVIRPRCYIDAPQWAR
jgi:hypothetical protein